MLDHGIDPSADPLDAAPEGAGAGRRESMLGRGDALAALDAMMGDGVCDRPRLLRLTGEAGIGKSTVVSALRPLLWERGITVIGGKYGQLRRAGPYSAFGQAFAVMLHWILTRDEATVARWRARIMAALAPNTQVLLDLLPEYERLLGAQPPVPKLGLSETRIRVSLVARRFVSALAGEAPLVIVLDDLQWADDASLNLLETLLSDSEIANLTVLAIYRDNEVDAKHPARLLLARLGSTSPLPSPVELRGLSSEEVEALVRELLGVRDAPLGELPALVHRKTQGNPLFVRQFVLTLQRKGLLEVDGKTVRFDETGLARERLTDNVVDLVIERIVALPDASRELIEIASCCLAAIDRNGLAALSGRSPDEVDAALVPAFEADVMAPGEIDGSIVFQHDRVREGAYALVPPERRSFIHAALARYVAREPITGGQMRMLHADHLLSGRGHLDPAQESALHGVLVEAAESARRGNAHTAALYYLDAALEIEPSFGVRLRRIEILYLLGRYGDARHAAELLEDDAPDDVARVQVLRTRVVLATVTLNYRDALTLGQRALSMLGERIAIEPSRATLLGAVAATRMAVGGRDPDTLLALPSMRDARKLAAMEVLLEMVPAAYFASATLFPALALKMVRLSLRHGNAPESAYAYALYGVVQTALLRDPDRGLAFGELARRAVHELNAPEREGSVFMVYAGFLLHWTAPLTRTLPIFLDGAERAIAAGDVDNHGYLRYGHASYAFMAGMPLDRIDAFLVEHLEAVRRHPHDKTLRIMTMARASIARMRGRMAPAYNEAEYLELWREQRDATSLAYFHKYRMLEALMDGDYGGVRFYAQGITEHLNGVLGMAYQPFYTFYEALASVELATKREHARRTLLARASRLTRRLARWSANGAKTLAPRVLLLRAEIAAARGAAVDAMRLFDEALAAARSAQALHDVALFHERHARFQAASGAHATARLAIGEAVVAYRDWGADGWADRLAVRHDLPTRSVGAERRDDDEKGSYLEAFAAHQNAEGIARELALLLRESAGAHTVHVRVIGRADRLFTLKGEATVAEAVELDDKVSDPPFGMAMNFVRRTREALLLDRHHPREPFASDSYWLSRADRDVVCLPIVAHDEVRGVVALELEGNTAPLERVAESVSGIVAQAAVALENASLVERLRGSLDSQVEMTSAHARFVPHAFLQVIGRPTIADVRLGDFQQRSASVLFSDIRGFTSRIEALAPEDALAFVNGYLSLMEPFVQENGGFIDSYVGDAVMAVFDRGPEAAIRASTAMNRALRKWRGVAGVTLSEPLRIGVGIASGDLIFGTLGAANRLKVGVVGDVVNLAARVEGLTVGYDCSVLTTRETVEGLPEEMERWTRFAGWTSVKGREAPVCLAEAFHADDDAERGRKSATRALLERFTTLQDENRPIEARDAIVEAAERFPDDALIAALLARFGGE